MLALRPRPPCSLRFRPAFVSRALSSGPKIYTSPHRSIPPSSLPRTSLFDHLFPSPSATISHPSNFSPSLPAFVDSSTDQSLTRGDVLERASSLSRALHARQSRGTAGLFMGNGLDWPVAFVGCQKAGWKTALFAGSLSPSDLAHQLALSKPNLTITTPTLLPALLEAYSLHPSPPSEAEIKRTTVVASSTAADGFTTLDKFITAVQDAPQDAEVVIDCDDTAVICFSSGTEGLSKGVETTHANLTALLDMMNPPVMPLMEPGKDILLGILPFSHIYGLFKLILMPLQRGFPVVIVPKVDLKTICSAIQTYETTAAILVPPILIHLANSKIVDKYDLSSLRWLLSGAAPLGPSLTLAIEERFAEQDLVLLQGFGMTETSPVTHILQLDDARSRPGSIGRLIPNVSARIVDPDTGLDASEGEMWIKGPNVMKGYLDNPTATAGTFTTDGWLKTGDIISVDQEGYFFVIDRRKELIKYNGHQVAPAELEALLLTHPSVGDVGVIGVWSEEERSEVPRAYIVPKASTVELPDEESKVAFGREVEGWIRSKVAPHKFLRGGVIVIEAIPKSASGKILRRQLRDLARQSEGTSVG